MFECTLSFILSAFVQMSDFCSPTYPKPLSISCYEALTQYFRKKVHVHILEPSCVFLKSIHVNEGKHCGSYLKTFSQVVSSLQSAFSNPANPSKHRQNMFSIFREAFSNHQRPQTYLYVSSTCSVSGSGCWSIT